MTAQLALDTRDDAERARDEHDRREWAELVAALPDLLPTLLDETPQSTLMLELNGPYGLAHIRDEVMAALRELERQGIAREVRVAIAAANADGSQAYDDRWVLA